MAAKTAFFRKTALKGHFNAFTTCITDLFGHNQNTHHQHYDIGKFKIQNGLQNGRQKYDFEKNAVKCNLKQLFCKAIVNKNVLKLHLKHNLYQFLVKGRVFMAKCTKL